MIQLLMGIAALLLLFVSYYLLKKQPIFFVLIEETEKNRGYLQFYGALYAFLGVLGIFVAFFNQRFIALAYLLLVIIVASVFSFTFARKMVKPNSK
ncbi:hypothetical protein [Enterococcus hirae]|uniref:hypothetical protein n=1 Tax=Enterococcus hirae TaxID=1354 RepID=UPI001A957C05|nr:hypothetical protein [Enterococcus hirae]MBO1089088.1 hypothetical protein [Enterococcus hirae]MEB7518096.1 hypothetical protein [Enterococcus hirae]